MHDASGLFFVFLYGKGFLGDQRWNRWGRGHKGAKVLFTFKGCCSLLHRVW